jgi:hypothetical protein
MAGMITSLAMPAHEMAPATMLSPKNRFLLQRTQRPSGTTRRAASSFTSSASTTIVPSRTGFHSRAA